MSALTSVSRWPSPGLVGGARPAGRGGCAALAPPVLPARGPRPVHPTHAGIDGRREIRVSVTHGELKRWSGPGRRRGRLKKKAGGPGPASGELSSTSNSKRQAPVCRDTKHDKQPGVQNLKPGRENNGDIQLRYLKTQQSRVLRYSDLNSEYFTHPARGSGRQLSLDDDKIFLKCSAAR